MTLNVNVVKDESIRATTLHGRVVLPNQARHVWNLDEMEWYALARVMGENIINITMKAGPHSMVALEFYIEPVALAPVPVVKADAMLVFSSDIPEFDGNGISSSKAENGTFTVAALGTKRKRGHNAGSFDLEFPGQSRIHGTYFVKKFAGKHQV